MEIIGKENGTILERGLDTLRDPAVPKYAKIAAVGVIAIGAVACRSSIAVRTTPRTTGSTLR